VVPSPQGAIAPSQKPHQTSTTYVVACLALCHVEVSRVFICCGIRALLHFDTSLNVTLLPEGVAGYVPQHPKRSAL
jgi:hypothetical protein